MKLWMSSEQMQECCGSQKIQRELEARINELIEDCTLSDYVEWCVITIILNEKGPDYKEIIRRSLKNKVLEFRLKIDYYDFIKADYGLKKKYVLEVLLKSIDLMGKWREIKTEEREQIKHIICNEYSDLLN